MGGAKLVLRLSFPCGDDIRVVLITVHVSLPNPFRLIVERLCLGD